jgi:hypothetical protein
MTIKPPLSEHSERNPIHRRWQQIAMKGSELVNLKRKTDM